MTFKKFLKARTESEVEIINAKAIMTYKWLHKLGLMVLFLTVANLILLISGSMLVVGSLLLSIILMITIPIWITYSKYILKSDKVLAFIAGVIFTIMIFSVAYYILQDYNDGKAFILNDKLNETSFLTWFYYSVIVFSTVGFGDITPVNTIAIVLTTSEVILHYIFIIFGLSLLFQHSGERDKTILFELKNYINNRE